MCPFPLIFQPSLANNACPINYCLKRDLIFFLRPIFLQDILAVLAISSLFIAISALRSVQSKIHKNFITYAHPNSNDGKINAAKYIGLIFAGQAVKTS